MLKHKLVLTGSVVAAAVCIGYAVHQHQITQQQVLAKAKTYTSQAKQLLEIQAHAQATANKLKESQSEVVQLQTQCQIGAKQYYLLTPYAKLQATIPVCSLQNAAIVKQ